MESMIEIDQFQAVDIRVGTVTRAQPFPEARKPALQMEIDFGPGLGRRQSSAQITGNYQPAELVGRQVLAIVNLPPRQIGPFLSQVLVLGLNDSQGEVVLIAPDQPVPNGQPLH